MRDDRTPRRRTGARRALAAAAALLALVATAGACTADAPDDEAVPPSSTVVQPGRPGEESSTLGPDELAERPDDSGYDQADVDYMTQMIHHHLQALEVSELAPDRAQEAQVVAIADRIDDVQGAEVHGLVAWLQQHDLPVPAGAGELVEGGDGQGPRAPEAHGHDHGGADMPGMLSDAQLDAMAAADGARFDRLYLQGMIQHHQGAVEMSRTVLEDGTNERVNELATDIGAGQQAEVGRLKDILATLS